MKYQHCVLLPFSLILMGAGIVTLLLFGIGKLEPYTHTKDFRTATCTVLSSNVSAHVPCKHQDVTDPDKTIHISTFPCLTIFVNFTERLVQYDQLGIASGGGDIDELDNVDMITDGDSNTTMGPNTTMDPTTLLADKILEQKVKPLDDELMSAESVLLYDSFKSWTLQRLGASNSTCTMHVCQEKTTDNERAVNDFLDDYGNVGSSFRCYFNPRNKNEVFAEVVSGNSVMHALVWSALSIGFGVFLFVVVAFLSCEVWICRNPKRAQRRMQGQTYELANRDMREISRHGWRTRDIEMSAPAGSEQPKRREGDGNNNSRLPNLSAAADIIRKWSYRTRSDRTSSSSNKETDTNRSSRSYAGKPSREWSLGKTDRTHFPTT